VDNGADSHTGVEKRSWWGELPTFPQILPQETRRKNPCESRGIGHFPPLLPHFHRYYYYYVFI
jgi:hypothetical protein